MNSKNNRYIRINNQLLVLIISLINFQFSFAQMSGTYTINSGATASSTNFTTFQSLADSLSAKGINGNVTVNVVSNSGPYNENVIFDAITGVSQNNTITINGNDNTITHSGSSTAIATILLRGVKFMTIQDLTVINSSNTVARNIQLRNGSNNNKIINCTLTQPNMSSGSDANAYIYIGNGGNNTMFTYSMAGQSNLFKKIKCNAGNNRGPYAGIFLVGPEENKEKKYNIVDSCEISDFFFGGIMSYYQDEGFICSNNIIFNHHQSNTRQRYGIYCEHFLSAAEITISNNKIFNLNGSNNNGPIPASFNVIGIYLNDVESISSNKNKIYNNIIDIAGSTDMSGIQLFSLDAPGSDIDHNTFLLRNPENARNNTGSIYGLLHYDLNGNVRNNIFYSNFNMTSGDLYIESRFFSFGSNIPSFSYNCMNLSDVTGSGGIHYGNDGSNLSTWSAWLQSSVNNGNNFSDINPRFVNPNNGDYNFGGVGMSKRGTAISYIDKDINGNNRDTLKPQVGALESYVDFEILSLDFNTNATECSNFEKEITFTVRNNNNFTAKEIAVSYDINGGNKITQIFQDTIVANDSATFTFSDPHLFRGNDSITLNVYIDGDDENNANNLKSYTFSLVATPIGVILSEGNMFSGYYRAGTIANPDVTAPGFEVEYDFTAPAKYSFSDYNSTWQITNESSTLSGDNIDANEGFTIDGGMGLISFDPISSLEGDTIKISLLIQDLNTGCDTSVNRYLYVPHTPRVEFDVEDVCLGKTSEFKNLSTMAGTNIMLNKWRFNDPNVALDTSEASDGFHTYSTFGTKTIELEVINQAYPKFIFSQTKSIEVKPLPLVSFRIRNGCEGIPISFTNNTTLPSGVSGAITYLWDFGDGSNPQTGVEPSHLYQNSGEYFITLGATLDGCTAELTRNANQFPTPKADFEANSVCANTPLQINNKTTISIGNVGFSWDLGNNVISTLPNPIYTYNSAGEKNIVLKATSEFGCENEITKTVLIKESPKANFNYDRACILTPTKFNYEGELPSSITTSFYWEFDSEGSSIHESPSFQFSELGSKIVKLVISSDNGCIDSISKVLNVLVQPEVDFDYTPICAHEDMRFINKSRINTGNLTYLWDFGYGKSSTDKAPINNFGDEFGQLTVSLTAFLAGGCSNTMEKDVTVFKLPSSEFDIIKKEGKNVIVNAVENDAFYAWRMGDGNTYNTQQVDHFYDVENGDFKICLSTISTNDCKSKNDENNCQSLNINLASSDDIIFDDNILDVYPNPSNGTFTLFIENAQSSLEIIVFDIFGKILTSDVSYITRDKWSINLGDVTAGIYFIQVKNGIDYSIKKIVINK